MYNLRSVPAWSVTPSKEDDEAERYEPLVVPPTSSPQLVEKALARVEYRTLSLLARMEQAAATEPGLLAKSPNDLPALLRTADQLLTIAKQEAGESASVWRCECGSRYAVPVSLMRPVSIRCERCGRTLDLDPGVARPSSIEDPVTAEVNGYRRTVSAFFKEAMARSWLVLVKKA
jgi:hypothetical protein